jgi:hypothetical protein
LRNWQRLLELEYKLKGRKTAAEGGKVGDGVWEAEDSGTKPHGQIKVQKLDC